eukprot:Protomagalhaensia_sp_Gyna_25__6124@NODE_997_length_2313_cov_89_952946_g795_i0_p1_GENE_NODE_997_length_2313_cov_89_952946_g795_i0NODE_997_length_2313_cov_89_952946_g795_i0_p1_ORF_typecomplete_len365_score19_52_NODE_997_length_2313_cov_89_952946_g795_i0491143
MMASRQWDPLFVLQVCLPRFICLLSVDLRFKLCQVNRYFRTTLLTPYWEAEALLGCLRDHWCGDWPDEILVALHLVQHENYPLGPDTAPDWSSALYDLFGSEPVVEEQRPPSEGKKLPCPIGRVTKERPPSLKLSNWHQAYAVCAKLKGETVRTLTSESQVENWLQRTVIESEPPDTALLYETPCVCFENDAWDVAKQIVRLYWSSRNHLQMPIYPLALLKHSLERREWALADPIEFIKATHNTHSHWSPLSEWQDESLRGMPVNDLGDLSDLDYDTVCSWQWLCYGKIQPYTGDWSAHMFETQAQWLAERTVRFAKTWWKTHSMSPRVDQQRKYLAVWFNWSLGSCALIGAQQRLDILFTKIC